MEPKFRAGQTVKCIDTIQQLNDICTQRTAIMEGDLVIAFITEYKSASEEFVYSLKNGYAVPESFLSE